MVHQESIDDVKRHMESAIEALKKEFIGLRTGRANVGLLDSVTIEVYGAIMPLNQVSNVNVLDSHMITVQVWDKNMVKSVEKAINQSGLGLNPSSDGQIVRVPIPPLNEERRAELQKIAYKYAEHTRISVRNIRRSGMDVFKNLERDGLISKDEQRSYEKEIQLVTDEAIKLINEILSRKEKEIITV
ncbi:MAG: ribosome recycling factor [Rhodospirillaceae bacterium]|jgi:ribosome recycling factor|nr:ribosome recycling factor [Rhodospirillaceae bacterium]